MRASEMTRMRARARNASEICGWVSGKAARRRSSASSRAVAPSTSPCAKPASAALSSEWAPSCGAMRRSSRISLPTDSAVTIFARCSGSAASGNTAIRLYMRPSHSSRSGGTGSVTMRRRSRKVSMSRRRVRKAGESGGNKYRCLPGLGDPRTDRDEEEPNDDGEAEEGLNLRQGRKFDDRGAGRPNADAHHETQSKCVGLIGSRREQRDDNGRKRDGESTVRPCGNNPEKLHRADDHECAPGVDESRPPVGHVEPYVSARVGADGIAGQQRECLESIHQADQNPRTLVGEEPQ